MSQQVPLKGRILSTLAWSLPSINIDQSGCDSSPLERFRCIYESFDVGTSCF